ncbi:hypothetical protein FSPOR_9915 [Fusarium sporotrichioides]|uniref:Uncharacterized protein n=1 Tax=Fusarium sporotrichioides TaxID=5514 RepID=A0A395RP97_FUSSP|nr:hypothetical protein FSPOR_9915 [Fusarium sporotrichioides]
MFFKSFVLPALFTIVRAAEDGVRYEYRTATITQCFTRDGLAAPTPVVIGATAIVYEPAVTGGPIIVEVDAPNCESCGCPTCVHTVEYTTRFQCFCSTGLCDQEYAIKEKYSGMKDKPAIDSHSIPFGFTCDVQTCTTCGPEPITATITYPVKDRPYMNDVAHPTAVPSSGSKGDDYKSEGSSNNSNKGEDYDNGSEHDNGAKPVSEPNYPDAPVPAKKPEGEPMPMPMPKPNESNGFHSSVKPTSDSGAQESSYPGAGDEHPVIVSGAAGQEAGIVGAGVAVVMVLLSI